MPLLKKPLFKKFADFFTPSANADKNCIGVFISIPKNGTYTVKNLLKLNKLSDRKYDDIIINRKHERGSVLQKNYNFENLFVFCFVRDPYDRTISWYEYHKGRNLEPYTSLSFEEWIREGMPHHWTILKDSDWEKENISPLLQYNFISDCKVDFIGHTEHFERDMKTIIENLNQKLLDSGREIEFEFSQVQKNKSNRLADIDHYFTPETKKIVSEILHKDFEYFGYDK
ncbi:sulfotransferase family 2 domain-containing protein [Rhodohalobacter sp. 614A]|uniref:sulfotransferase family 2 domain-containing protein n=1 Tax=Rhodohalobacter sp. 614A TaxID=2908649 RepID=UPI001F225F26|nr:sulfotransferase family 2 domain-containing protein [Rhodohalobacter sp. 614A]